jgi:hypothetical protein
MILLEVGVVEVEGELLGGLVWQVLKSILEVAWLV